jgi:hypothetical protein
MLGALPALAAAQPVSAPQPSGAQTEVLHPPPSVGGGDPALTASGSGSRLDVSELALVATNNAQMSRAGESKLGLLFQSGAPNTATRWPSGEPDALATQAGGGERLQWGQLGSGLTDLTIRHSAGAPVTVSQGR